MRWRSCRISHELQRYLSASATASSTPSRRIGDSLRASRFATEPESLALASLRRYSPRRSYGFFRICGRPYRAAARFSDEDATPQLSANPLKRETI
jgi:hypothetical protein